MWPGSDRKRVPDPFSRPDRRLGLDDLLSPAADILSGVAGVHDESCMIDDELVVVGAVIRADKHRVVGGQRLGVSS